MTIYHELPAGYIRRLKSGESIAILNRDYGLNHATSHRLRKKLGLVAFEHLSPEQRYTRILPLRMEGLPHRAIAQQTGWSPTTVLKTIHLFEGKQ